MFFPKRAAPNTVGKTVAAKRGTMKKAVLIDQQLFRCFARRGNVHSNLSLFSFFVVSICRLSLCWQLFSGLKFSLPQVKIFGQAEGLKFTTLVDQGFFRFQFTFVFYLIGIFLPFLIIGVRLTIIYNWLNFFAESPLEVCYNKHDTNCRRALILSLNFFSLKGG